MLKRFFFCVTKRFCFDLLLRYKSHGYIKNIKGKDFEKQSSYNLNPCSIDIGLREKRKKSLEMKNILLEKKKTDGFSSN